MFLKRWNLSTSKVGVTSAYNLPSPDSTLQDYNDYFVVVENIESLFILSLCCNCKSLIMTNALLSTLLLKFVWTSSFFFPTQTPQTCNLFIP